MAIFARLSNAFWSYVSPRRTQRERDKPFKVPVHSPSSYMSQYYQFTTPRRSRPATPGSHKVSKRTLKRDPSSHLLTPASSVHRPTSHSVYADDLDDDTLVELESVLDHGGDGGFDANDETVVVDEEHCDPEGVKFNPVLERKKRDDQAEELRMSGWSEDAIALYTKLSMRGYEPLLPKRWDVDFETMPDALFTPDDDIAFVKPALGTDFRATTALHKLITLGPRVRDTSASPNKTARRPEETMRRAIAAYTAWACADAKLNISGSGPSSSIPVLALETGSRDTLAITLQANLLAKLEALAERHKEALRVHSSIEGQHGHYNDEGEWVREKSPAETEYVHELPTLYGVIASHMVMAFVGYDMLAAEPSLTIIAMFDWRESDYDVWNSLAVAILVIHCRNRMMEMKEAMAQGAEQEEDYESEDPDA